MCYKRLVNPWQSLSFLFTSSFSRPCVVWHRHACFFSILIKWNETVLHLRIQTLWTHFPLKQSFGFLHIHLLPSWQCLILTSCHLQCFLFETHTFIYIYHKMTWKQVIRLNSLVCWKKLMNGHTWTQHAKVVLTNPYKPTMLSFRVRRLKKYFLNIHKS